MYNSYGHISVGQSCLPSARFGGFPLFVNGSRRIVSIFYCIAQTTHWRCVILRTYQPGGNGVVWKWVKFLLLRLVLVIRALRGYIPSHERKDITCPHTNR